MKTRFRHRVTFFLFRPFFKLFFIVKYNVKFITFKPKKGTKPPYLILGNHALAMDPILLTCNFKMPIHFVASDMIFSIKYWSFFIRHLAGPIPKTKYRSDIATIRDIRKVVKSGGTIGIFPEGNSTFSGRAMHIPKSTAKLVKLLKIPVVFYRIEGSYLSKPRWAAYSRKGKITGYVKEVWSYEAYKDLSIDAIYDHITAALDVDQIALQEEAKISYQGKRLAEDIESTFYYCPNCHQFHTLLSSDDEVRCLNCDLHLRFTEQGFLTPLNAQIDYFSKTTDWYDAQCEKLQSYLQNKAYPKALPIFQDNHEHVYENIPNKRKKRLGQATLELYENTLKIHFNHQDPTIWPLKDLNVAVQQKNKLIVHNHTLKKTYYFISHPKRNAIKYELAVKYLTQKEAT